MSFLTDIAARRGRAYITPEDVGDLLAQGHPVDEVRRDVLEVLAKLTGFGAEDHSLCAYLAWRGFREQGNRI